MIYFTNSPVNICNCVHFNILNLRLLTQCTRVKNTISWSSISLDPMEWLNNSFSCYFQADTITSASEHSKDEETTDATATDGAETDTDAPKAPATEPGEQ